MRILVMGTGPFAVPTAQRILQLGHDIALVITRPLADPAPKKLPVRPVHDWALSQGLPIFEPASINNIQSIEYLQSFQADLFFVCDYGQILSSDCLAAATLGGINLHGSLLPRHRGAAPVQWTLLSGDPVAGVTVIHMTPRLDAGPALAVRSLDILPDETAGELELRLAAVGVAATEESLNKLERWDRCSTLGVTQDRSLVTRAPRFSKHHGQLDFRLSADYLVRLLRACHPWPATFADLVWPGGKSLRLLIRAARSVDSASSRQSLGEVEVFSSSQLGLDWSEKWRTLLAVQTARGKFLISRVQPAGKREMDVAEFLRGHPLLPGTQFALPVPACPMLTAES